ncbi:hypothetical protein P7H98_13135 [Lactococcus lactis]|uniref:hypothetical protein n=1 Tax=Lactococcus lactis TaxID=1358 RepID=UPI00288FD7E1|nr:hypothetical protein [Lactococcus lactis]MDT2944293.1 hypothetical protein [Lactococcus lactis]
MTEIEKVTNNQAKARSIYNSLIKDNIFYTGISKNLAIALIELGIDSSTTDKLSVEKLQEQLNTAKKYIEESYKADKEDNKLLNLTIEVVAKLKSDNETLKKALTEIAEIINDDIHKCDYGCDNNCELNGSLNIYSVENVQSVIDSALAAIGGDDGQ